MWTRNSVLKMTRINIQLVFFVALAAVVFPTDCSMFCCRLQAVFADIQHTAQSVDDFPRQDMEKVIDQVASEDYEKASFEIPKTDWCNKHQMRCIDASDLIFRGCERR
ncbi:hypothetical protein R1sor_004827 [Riccia sorocarpa]|uniref:Uncharacterized protein n=1 Tax=Riccia sorocarpa TaxID=122646 RepID=A0ABD3HK04_9MARC